MWLLTARTIYQYLLNYPLIENDTTHLLLKNSDIGKGKFSAVEISKVSRNSNFRVTVGEQSYFLKQPKNFAENHTASIKNEANFYRFYKSINPPPLPCNVGKFLDYDEEKSILIFENEKNYRKVERLEFATFEFVEELVKSITQIHKSLDISQSTSNHKLLSYFKPTLLDQSRRRRLLLQMRVFQDKSIRLLADDIEQVESELNKIKWEFDAVIHRDVKYENCLIESRQDKTVNLKFIDWELAAIGDRDWDIANFCYPLLKSSNTTGRPNHDFGLSALYSLELVDWAFETYTNGQNPSQSTKKKKELLQFCAIQIVEYYINGILNKRFSPEVAFTEHARVIEFFELLRPQQDSFFNNYINGKM